MIHLKAAFFTIIIFTYIRQTSHTAQNIAAILLILL